MLLHRSVALSVAALALAACSSPTLEEACRDYCAAVAEAGCPNDIDCTAQCGSLEAQLEGKCVEEYTETFDCAAGEDFECRDGYASVTSQGCVEEALNLLSCEGAFDEE